MNAKAKVKYKILLSLMVGLAAALLFAMFISSGSLAHAQSIPTPIVNNIQTSPYLTVKTVTTANGTSLTDTIIHGPPVPPAGFSALRPAVTVKPASMTELTVPAYTWVDSCSAVSASMIAGYYDNNGYPNMYTGPTNGGVIPLTDSSWPTWTDSNGDPYPNNPLIASHNGVDGMTVNGSLDDYWVYYESGAQDPFIGNWTEHTWGSAIGDYMKSSQSNYGNDDGSTSFYNYTSSAAKLSCSDMPGYGIDTLDGTYGRMLFYQAKGYTVTDCYNQNTDNNGGGFTFANFQAEINAGHPVLLNLAGHSIVGVGYDTATNKVYVHNTWDTYTDSMTWGTSYANMQLLSVSIVNLASTAVVTTPTPIAPIGASYVTTPTFTWSRIPGATQYQFAVYQGTSTTPKYTKTVASSTCGASTTNCSNKPVTVLAVGSYKWKVQAYVSGAWKPYSSLTSFTVGMPKAGFWSTGGIEFYVTPAQNSVKNFAIYVSACGYNWKIWRTVPAPISNKHFSFTGSFYGSGTFNSVSSDSGQVGLKRYYLKGCGYASGGPWHYTATWQNSSQSSAAISTVDDLVTKLGLSNDLPGFYQAVKVDAP